MGTVQAAAYQALQLLKAGDEVCLFAFAGDVEMLEELTPNRQRVANRIGGIHAGGGTVINMSSGAALRGASPAHIYSAAKGGILALTRALAGTYARDSVRVNAICAGRILTERILARYGTPDDPKPAEDQQADARVKEYPFWVGTPGDIANIALFLASDESRMITGATIPADGGRSAY